MSNSRIASEIHPDSPSPNSASALTAADMEADPPGIAVIIPLFNGGRWIAQTLETVLAQTLPPAEIVVVDDGSTDHSVNEARRFDGVTVERSPQKGGGWARDHGLAVTRSPLVTFLDQDDLWSPTHLERLAALLTANPSAPAAVGRVTPFRDIPGGDHGQSFGDREPWVSRPLDPWRNYPFGTIECPSQVLMRRSALEKTGTWMAQTRFMADLEMWHRMALEGEVLCSDAITVGRRVHGTSFSGALRQDIGRYLEAFWQSSSALAAEFEKRRLEGDGGNANPSANPNANADPSQDLDWLRLRHAIAGEFRAIGDALSQRQTRRVVIHVQHLLQRLKEDRTPGFRAVALANLVWFLCPEGSPLKDKVQVMAIRDALDGSDGAAAMLSRFLDDAMARWPLGALAACVLWSPLTASRSALFRRVVEIRLPPRTLREWQGIGIDSDGWVKSSARLILRKRRNTRSWRLTIERPPWSGPRLMKVAICVTGTEAVEAELTPGWWTLDVPAGSTNGVTEIEFASSDAAPIPGDGRVRAFRIFTDDIRPSASANARIRLSPCPPPETAPRQ